MKCPPFIFYTISSLSIGEYKGKLQISKVNSLISWIPLSIMMQLNPPYSCEWDNYLLRSKSICEACSVKHACVNAKKLNEVSSNISRPLACHQTLICWAVLFILEVNAHIQIHTRALRGKQHDWYKVPLFYVCLHGCVHYVCTCECVMKYLR